MQCDELPEAMPVYAVGRLDVPNRVLEYGRLLRGTDDPDRDPLTGSLYELEEVDLNGDGLPDYVLRGGGFEDGDDGFAPDCGNYGECVLGVAVSCQPRAHAIVVRPEYVYELRAGRAWTVVAGRRWRTVVLTHRDSDGQADEADMMDRGERVFTPQILRWTPAGYRGRRVAPEAQADACTQARRAAELERARVECDIALDAVDSDGARGAVYYELGQIAELEGDRERAIEMYRSSLEARPGNQIVQRRLDALAQE